MFSQQKQICMRDSKRPPQAEVRNDAASLLLHFLGQSRSQVMFGLRVNRLCLFNENNYGVERQDGTVCHRRED